MAGSPACTWKTEYRFSEFDRRDNAEFFAATGVLTGDVSRDRMFTQHRHHRRWSYRFNWGGRRLSRSTDLSRTDQLKSPGICRGFFVSWRRMAPLHREASSALVLARQAPHCSSCGCPADDSQRVNPCASCCLIAGFLALAIGLLWIGQGTGVIAWPASSFMISQIQWAGTAPRWRRVGLILIWQGKR